MVMMHVRLIRLRGHFGGIAGKNMVSLLFLLFGVFFLFSQSSRVRFWGLILWRHWIGRARHPGPGPHSRHFGLETSMSGGG